MYTVIYMYAYFTVCPQAYGNLYIQKGFKADLLASDIQNNSRMLRRYLIKKKKLFLSVSMYYVDLACIIHNVLAVLYQA